MLRSLLAVLIAGWLADAFARTDADIDAGIAAYTAGEYDEALSRFAAAEARLGERSEIFYDKGLALLAKGDVDGARQAFERGSESEREDVRSSSHYQLGNLAFDREDWDAAIASYVDALKVRPDHGNAKWNLELALQRKREKEQQEKKDDQEQQDQQQGQDEQEDDSQDSPPNEDEQQGDPEESQPSDDKPKDDPRGSDTGKDKRADQKQDEPKNGPQEQTSAEPDTPSAETAQPRPIDRMDLQRALEQLDAEDRFMLGRPAGRPTRPEKDW